MARQPSFKEAIARAYRQTPVYLLDRLLKEEKHWQRRQTIATNKLVRVRKEIARMALKLAHDSIEHGKQTP